MRSCIGLVAAFVIASFAVAHSPSHDKSEYHLFNPTPPELMRELATDRPDATESPYTVDAGHVQFEFSMFDYVHDGGIDSFSVMPTNIRIGLLNDLELAMVLEPFVHSEFAAAPGVIASDQSFGNIEIRAKYNLWGNDSDKSALAILPYVIIPTATDMMGHGHVEGGVAVPFAMDLREGIGLGLMAQFDIVYDPSRSEYGLAFLHTAAIGFDLIGSLAGFVEYIGIASSEPGAEYQVLLSTGLTYLVNPDWQLDAGVQVGMAGGAPDLNPFVGMSLRF